MARYPKKLTVLPSKLLYPDGTIKPIAELTPDERKEYDRSSSARTARIVKTIMERDPEHNVPIWSKYFETRYI